MVKIIGVLVALAMLAGCVAAPGVSDRPAASGIDGRHAEMLARQYQTMAALFGVNGQNGLSAQFQARGAAAALGQWLAPEPVPADAADFGTVARDGLMAALAGAMTEENAPFLARAQVNYDCWALSGDESCRSGFEKAMRSTALPAAALQPQAVYFDVDSSALSDETRAVLTATAAMLRMNRAINVHLTGSSEHQTQNRSLALRRAIAVRNLLTQMGIAAERIMVRDEDLGETILSQQSPESGADDQARRVDITLEPVFGEAI